MRTNFIVIFSQIFFQIMAPNAASEHKPSGGARGKTADTESNAANVSGSQRIYGGNETVPHEFPFHLHVIKRGFPMCGAVILDTEWAVTAGHCASSTVNVSEYVIYAGKHDKTIPESTEQQVSILKIMRHENYSKTTFPINDISVFKVSPPFEFNEYVQKVTLPKSSDEKYSTGTATAVGWGTTENELGSKVTKLRKVSLPLMTNERCQEMLESEEPGSIYPGNVCAGGVKGMDSCNGDSGGPLLFMEDGKQALIGLTSWGLKCGQEGAPGVYTRVTEFLDWIKDKTGIDLYGRADRPITVGPTAGDPGSGSKNGARAKISNSLAQTMCKSYDVYSKEKKLAPAFKVRPETPGKCGWAYWSRCKGQDSGSCQPFNFVICKV